MRDRASILSLVAMAVTIVSVLGASAAWGASFTFNFRNTSSEIITIELYSQNRNHVWPGRGQIWVIPTNGVTYSNSGQSQMIVLDAPATILTAGIESSRHCEPRKVGARVLRSPNPNDIHGDWADGFLGTSFVLIGVERHNGGFLSGCLLGPRGALDHDGSCPEQERVFVIAQEWDC